MRNNFFEKIIGKISAITSEGGNGQTQSFDDTYDSSFIDDVFQNKLASLDNSCGTGSHNTVCKTQ